MSFVEKDFVSQEAMKWIQDDASPSIGKRPKLSLTKG